MPVFTLNFISLFLWAFLLKLMPLSKESREKAFLGIIFVQFLLISGLRTYEVGQDLRNYLEGYREFEYNWHNALKYYFPNWEPGFLLLNLISTQLGIGFRLFFILIDAFAYYIVLRFINRYASIKWLGVVVFVAFGFFFASLHILRQTIALSIILLSYDALVEGRTKKFISLVILATCFHYTAFLFGLSLFLYRNRRMSLPVFLVLLIAVQVVGRILVSRFMAIALIISDKYDTYNDNGISGEGYGLLILLLLLTIVGYLYKTSRLLPNDRLIFFLVIVGCLMQAIATQLSIFARICWYWEYGVIAYIPLLITLNKNKHLRLLYTICAVAFLSAFFFLISNAQEGQALWATYQLME